MYRCLLGKNKLVESGSNLKAWRCIVNHVCVKGSQTEIPSFHQNSQLFDIAAEKAEILKDIFVSKSCLNDKGKNSILLCSCLTTIKIRTKVVEKKLKQKFLILLLTMCGTKVCLANLCLSALAVFCTDRSEVFCMADLLGLP